MPKKSFFERNAVFIVIALVAIAGYGIIKSKASLVDDCTKVGYMGNHAPYAKDFSYNFGLIAGSGSGSYDRAIVIDNVPSYAKISSASATLTFNGNSYGRPTQRGVGISYGEFCPNKVILGYEGDPAIGWVASDGGTMDYTNLGGTYTLAFLIKFNEQIPSPESTPTTSPSASPIDSPTPKSTVIVNPYVCQDGNFVSDLSKCKKQDSNNVLILIGLVGAFITGFYIFKKRK